MLYIIAHDTFFGGGEYDTGIRVVDDEVTVRNLLIVLHRGTTSTMYRAVDTLPEGVKEAA